MFNVNGVSSFLPLAIMLTYDYCFLPFAHPPSYTHLASISPLFFPGVFSH